jgi:hypothetical protein
MYDWDTLLTEVRAAIRAAWPEVTRILHVQQGQRRSYEGLSPPFAVYHLGAGQEAAWGIGNVVFQRELTVYYVMRWEDAAIETLPNKLEALKSSLLATSYATSGATLIDDGLVIDDTPENPANGIVLNKNISLIGGLLRVSFIAGENATVAV